MGVYRPTYTDPKTGRRKQGKTWWFELVFAGRRIRESAKTSRKTVAQEAEKRRRLDLERAAAGLPSDDQTAAQRIAEVRTLLKEYRDRCEVLARGAKQSTRTAAFARERSKPLEKHLGARLRVDLNEAAIVDYMKTRQSEGAGPRTINMEVELLSRALGQTWKVLWPRLARLKEPKDIGRALSVEEQRKLLMAAQTNRSPYIYPVVLLALQTGMRADEIRNLRWGSLDLNKRLLTVPKSKTAAGEGRTVPMTGTVVSAIEEYRRWYLDRLGAARAEWFLFPFSSRTAPVDPARSCTTLKHSWEATRRAADVQARFHDLRHTAVSMMLDAGAPEHAVRAIVGHVSPKMLERYAHARVDVKRKAVEALEHVGVPKDSPKVGPNLAVN